MNDRSSWVIETPRRGKITSVRLIINHWLTIVDLRSMIFDSFLLLRVTNYLLFCWMNTEKIYDGGIDRSDTMCQFAWNHFSSVLWTHYGHLEGMKFQSNFLLISFSLLIVQQLSILFNYETSSFRFIAVIKKARRKSRFGWKKFRSSWNRVEVETNWSIAEFFKHLQAV